MRPRRRPSCRAIRAVTLSAADPTPLPGRETGLRPHSVPQGFPLRHGRACPGYPLATPMRSKGVDTRHKAGHDGGEVEEGAAAAPRPTRLHTPLWPGLPPPHTVILGLGPRIHAFDRR